MNRGPSRSGFPRGCSPGAGAHATGRSDRWRGGTGSSSDRGLRCGTLMMTRPPGFRMRASSAAEPGVVRDVLQVVHHDDLVEGPIGEGRVGAVEPVHVVAHQLADGRHRVLVEVRAGPRPPRRRSRRLITPLSAPMSRHRRPAGSSIIAVIRRNFACLSTDFWNSATAHSALTTSPAGSRPAGGGAATVDRARSRRRTSHPRPTP